MQYGFGWIFQRFLDWVIYGFLIGFLNESATDFSITIMNDFPNNFHRDSFLVALMNSLFVFNPKLNGHPIGIQMAIHYGFEWIPYKLSLSVSLWIFQHKSLCLFSNMIPYGFLIGFLNEFLQDFQ